MNQLVFNKTLPVEICQRSIYQELNCVLKTLRMDDTCDIFTLKKILKEQFNGFVVDPIEPNKKWFTTFVPLKEFRAHEVTYTVKKDNQGVICIEVLAKRQPVNDMDVKCEVSKLIRLPIDLEYNRIRVLFTTEHCVLIKVPFRFTEEQRFFWLNKVMNSCQPLFPQCVNEREIFFQNQTTLNTTCDITREMLNGWGPITTEEMHHMQKEIQQLLPLMHPFTLKPTFWKDTNAQQHKIILDLYMPFIVRPEEINVKTIKTERKICFEIKAERQIMHNKVECMCDMRRNFVVPQQVVLEKLETKLLPNGHIQFILPVELKQNLLPFEGQIITVKH